MPVNSNFTPGQILTAAQLNTQFGAAAAQSDLAQIQNGTATDAGALTGAETAPVSRGTGLLQTTLTKVAAWVVGSYQGFSQTWASGLYRSVLSKLRDEINAADGGVIGDGVTLNSTALQAMINVVPAGTTIVFNAGTYVLDPHYTVIATGEGTAINLGTDVANITLRANGNVVFVPTTNKVEMFSDSGTNIKFDCITFDNSANGVLQNTLKPATITPNGGVAGLGNQANCAIRQYAGAGGLNVTNCKFIGFNTDIEYYGNYADNTQLVGEVSINGMTMVGGCFGALIHKPTALRMYNCESSNTVNSINATGSATASDPGHLLYVTDRSGAIVPLVTVDGIQSANDIAEPVKIRSGARVIATNINVNLSGRGASFWSLSSLTLGNINIKLAQVDTTDASMAALEITDCANVTVGGPIDLDVTGVPAYGLRMRTDVAPTNAINGRIKGVTVHGDWTNVSLPPFYINGYTDTVIEEPTFMHSGTNVSTTYWPVSLIGCTRVSVIKPRHMLIGGGTAPTDATNVVLIDSACVNCGVDIDKTAINSTVAYVNDSTVHDRGTTSLLLGPFFGASWGPNGTVVAGTSGAAGMTTGTTGSTTIISAAIALIMQRLTTDGVFMRIYGTAGTVIGSWQTSGTTTQLSLDAANTVFFTTMNGTPQSVLTAGVGSVCVNRAGAAGAILWVKTSGTSNTGWTAIA